MLDKEHDNHGFKEHFAAGFNEEIEMIHHDKNPAEHDENSGLPKNIL